MKGRRSKIAEENKVILLGQRCDAISVHLTGINEQFAAINNTLEPRNEDTASNFSLVFDRIIELQEVFFKVRNLARENRAYIELKRNVR